MSQAQMQQQPWLSTLLRLVASSPSPASVPSACDGLRKPCCVCCHLLLPCIQSEVKFVVASGSKLPALLKALPGLEGELVAVMYWGAAADSAVQVGWLLFGSAAAFVLTAATLH